MIKTDTDFTGRKEGQRNKGAKAQSVEKDTRHKTEEGRGTMCKIRNPNPSTRLRTGH